MSFIDCFLLALALAMDCFSVSISCGIVQKRMGRQALVMAFFFGLFQALMPFLGWLAAEVFSKEIMAYDHWIAFGLLAFLGGKMVYSEVAKYLSKEEDDHEEKTGFNPSDICVLLTLAVATSIDALAVGFTFPGLGVNSLADMAVPLLIIGIVSAVMSLVGKYIGLNIGRRFNCPAELFGGLILIGIGVKVLVQHL